MEKTLALNTIKEIIAINMDDIFLKILREGYLVNLIQIFWAVFNKKIYFHKTDFDLN